MKKGEAGALLGEWWQLPPARRLEVQRAVDRGQRVDDQQLRRIAVGLATKSLTDSGWAMLRRPAYVFPSLLIMLVLVVLGFWPFAILVAVVGATCLSVAERRARRLRPYWQRAIDENSVEPNK